MEEEEGRKKGRDVEKNAPLINLYPAATPRPLHLDLHCESLNAHACVCACRGWRWRVYGHLLHASDTSALIDGGRTTGKVIRVGP